MLFCVSQLKILNIQMDKARRFQPFQVSQALIEGKKSAPAGNRFVGTAKVAMLKTRARSGQLPCAGMNFSKHLEGDEVMFKTQEANMAGWKIPCGWRSYSENHLFLWFIFQHAMFDYRMLQEGMAKSSKIHQFRTHCVKCAAFLHAQSWPAV